MYLLPSHPSLTCLDPLGLCDEENPTVWSVITSAIYSFRAASKLHELPNLIADLSYSVHMDGKTNTEYLYRYLVKTYPDCGSTFSLSVLNCILDDALLLPALFPMHMIPYLDEKNPIVHLTMQEVRCLLAHQILNTLSPPLGNTWGCTFTCWYSEPQPLENAVSGYLGTLFHYFTLPLDNTANMAFQYFRNPLNAADNVSAWIESESRPIFDHVVLEPTSTGSVPFPHETAPCTLIASNKYPGFGAACTQEELVTGACPPLLLLGALFISPPIPPEVALLAYGHATITRWKGQGREARSLGTYITLDHVFLLLDASELDIISDSPTVLTDLNPQYLLRDLNKAYTGFLALRELNVSEISSPLWGAGAFSGDPIIKSLILALAAARAGITVRLTVDKERIYRPEDGNLTTVLSALQHFKQHSTSIICEVMTLLTSQGIAECRNGLDVLQRAASIRRA